MSKFSRRGIAVSLSAHVLFAAAFVGALPQQKIEPDNIEFISLDVIPPEPIKEPPKEEEPALSSGAVLAPKPAKPQHQKASAAPPTKEEGNGLAASVGASAESAEPSVDTPDGATGLPKKGPTAGDLAFSFQDFQGIKGELNIPRAKSNIEKNLPMQAMPSFAPSPITASNQAPLGAKMAPFSAYLHSMHLKIHPLWSEGALRQFEEMDAESPVNQLSKELTVELVINADGTLESATPIGSSGDSRYDMAAMYALKNAAPFKAPPKNLLSHQDRVYVRWTLYRDARECAAKLAQPFWLVSAEGEAPLVVEDEAHIHAPAEVKEEKSAKEKLLSAGKAIKDSAGSVRSMAGVKSDGFGGVSEFPDHGFFGDGNETMIMFNVTKNKPAGPPVDELSKRKW